MWVVFIFMSYLALALLIPTVWALAPVWRRARVSRPVNCPASREAAVIELDTWYAVKMHTLGNDERRIGACSRWPERRGCGQECLVQISAAG